MPLHIAKAFQLVFFGILVLEHVRGQMSKVSSKLDFDSAADINNSSVAKINGTESKEDGFSDNGKSGPKIHGVRITVDTGDTDTINTFKESKESGEVTDVGKHKKRVGIHTDITFEISDNDNATTISAQKEEKEEDASVPIYKGRGGGSTNKAHKPYDTRSQWSPNFSSERRYDTSGLGYSPQYPTYNNIPAYGDSGSGYRSNSGWTNYVPSVWTTERTYYEGNTPNFRQQQSQNWRPCYCVTTDNRRRRENKPVTTVLRPTSSVIKVIDGKLDRPFS